MKATTSARSPPRRAGLFFALTSLGLAWLGWQIIGNTIADTKSQSDPIAALAWRSELPTALVALADQRMVAAENEEDLVAVSSLGQRALAASPVQEGALRLMGLSADLRGDAGQARTLMELAGNRSRHDAIAQVWLLDQNIRQGRMIEALSNADALLRTRPEIRKLLLPALSVVAEDTIAKKALVERLAADPPWRSWLLSELPKAVAPSTGFAVLSGLQVTDRPPRNNEIQPYLVQLIEAGRFELAYLSWLHFLPAGTAKPISYAYNGDFELPPSGLSFDWVIAPITGARTDIVDTGESGRGKAVRVTFANTRVLYRHLSKLMILPPGRYQLSGEASTDGLVTERGLAWRIYCAEGANKKPIGESALFKGTVSWHRFTTGFEVPPTDCRAQWVRLELAARVALEQEIGGEIWFDNLTVERRPQGAQ